MKIAVIDSGVGGLSILEAIVKLLPNEQYIYFGDSLNVPYGDKTNEQIRVYTQRVIKFLMTFDMEILVIACNTINSFMYKELVDQLKIPIIGVAFPTASYVNSLSPLKVGVIGTSRTIENKLYKKIIESEVYELATPSFVSLVENNEVGTPKAYEEVKKVLKPLIKENVSLLVLGCTHYPFLMNEIKASYSGTVVESGLACALEVEKRLKNKKRSNTGSVEIYVSSKLENFKIFLDEYTSLNYEIMEVKLDEKNNYCL